MRRNISNTSGSSPSDRSNDSISPRQRTKLLEAHYADAIPLELFSEEEKRITEAVTAITAKTQAVRVDTNQVEQRLQMALDLTSTIAEAYKQAPEHIRKIMNHVFFDRVLVFSDPNAVNGVRLQTKLQEPFARLTNSDMRQTEAQWRLTTTKHAPVFNGGRVLRSLRSGKLFT